MEGATSISTILLVDVILVGSSPPYIYVSILLEKDITTIELSLEVSSLKNLKIVNYCFPLLTTALPSKFSRPDPLRARRVGRACLQSHRLHL